MLWIMKNTDMVAIIWTQYLDAQVCTHQNPFFFENTCHLINYFKNILFHFFSCYIFLNMNVTKYYVQIVVTTKNFIIDHLSMDEYTLCNSLNPNKIITNNGMFGSIVFHSSTRNEPKQLRPFPLQTHKSLPIPPFSLITHLQPLPSLSLLPSGSFF